MPISAVALAAATLQQDRRPALRPGVGGALRALAQAVVDVDVFTAADEPQLLSSRLSDRRVPVRSVHPLTQLAEHSQVHRLSVVVALDPAGVRQGKGAGLTVLGLPLGGTSPQSLHQAGADLVLRGPDDLQPWLSGFQSDTGPHDVELRGHAAVAALIELRANADTASAARGSALASVEVIRYYLDGYHLEPVTRPQAHPPASWEGLMTLQDTVTFAGRRRAWTPSPAEWRNGVLANTVLGAVRELRLFVEGTPEGWGDAAVEPDPVRAVLAMPLLRELARFSRPQLPEALAAVVVQYRQAATGPQRSSRSQVGTDHSRRSDGAAAPRGNGDAGRTRS